MKSRTNEDGKRLCMKMSTMEFKQIYDIEPGRSASKQESGSKDSEV